MLAKSIEKHICTRNNTKTNRLILRSETIECGHGRIKAWAATFKQPFSLIYVDGAGPVGFGDGRIIARAALVMVIWRFRMIENDTKRKGGRCVGVEWLCGSWYYNFFDDLASSHEGLDHSWMRESYFVGAVGGNKKSNVLPCRDCIA